MRDLFDQVLILNRRPVAFAAIAEGAVDFLLRTAGIAARANRRATADAGCASGSLGLLGPRLTFLKRARFAQDFGNAETLGLGAACADHDIVVGRTRARIGAIDDDFAPALGVRRGAGERDPGNQRRRYGGKNKLRHHKSFRL